MIIHPLYGQNIIVAKEANMNHANGISRGWTAGAVQICCDGKVNNYDIDFRRSDTPEENYFTVSGLRVLLSVPGFLRQEDGLTLQEGCDTLWLHSLAWKRLPQMLSKEEIAWLLSQLPTVKDILQRANLSLFEWRDCMPWFFVPLEAEAIIADPPTTFIPRNEEYTFRLRPDIVLAFRAPT